MKRSPLPPTKPKISKFVQQFASPTAQPTVLADGRTVRTDEAQADLADHSALGLYSSPRFVQAFGAVGLDGYETGAPIAAATQSQRTLAAAGHVVAEPVAKLGFLEPEFTYELIDPKAVMSPLVPAAPIAQTPSHPDRPKRVGPQITPVFEPNMEDVFDQLWLTAQRRMMQGPEEAESDDDGEIRHHSIQSIVVTSWDIGAGTSSVALGLAARAAAQSTGDVCLVDADFTFSGLTHSVQMQRAPGLRELLLGKASRDEVIVPINGSRLCFLPIGQEAGPDVLASDHHIQRVVADLEDRFRYVFYDVSSLKQGMEAYRLGRFVVNTILVVPAGQSRRQTIAHAITALRLQGMQLLGAVLSQRKDPIPQWLYSQL